MSTSVTNVVSHFPSAENGFTTTLASTISSGAITVPLNSVAGYTNGETVVFVVDPADATKKQTFTGIIDTAGVQVTSVVWTAGTNQTHAGGATVVDYVTATHISMVSKGILEEHKPTGAHSDITADSITVLGDVEAASFTLTGAGGDNGWSTGLPAPDTVTYNGNRSYDLVFNGTDLTDTVSNGMRLRATRTVTPPTQCTDLEASSSQYASKSSPSGITFTDDFTIMGWINLESYQSSVDDNTIFSRRTASQGFGLRVDDDGTVSIFGINTTADVCTSYQSVPLNRWVHVAATLNMSGAAGAVYIDGQSVPTSYTNGAVTSLVQAGDLKVGGNHTATYFDGKISQVALFDAVLSAATIRSYASQTLTGSETNCIGFWELDGDFNDSSSNANNLTASGGAGFTTGSPFNSTEYGIITANSFSTDTTLTVQVPEGYAIPTSGGVSAVAYSTQSVPYGFPRQKDKWALYFPSKSTGAMSTATDLSNSLNLYSTIPVGSWSLSYKFSCSGERNAGSVITMAGALSENNSDSNPYSESVCMFGDFENVAPHKGWYTMAGSVDKEYTTATVVYVLDGGLHTTAAFYTTSGTGANNEHYLKAECAYI